MMVRASPFHMRSAKANVANAWVGRNGYVLPAHYGDPLHEAIAARLSVIVSDISWRWRVRIEGARSVDCLSRMMTRDPSSLDIGKAFKALWLNDAGAVRGAGALGRLGAETFLLVSAMQDRSWVSSAAKLFGVRQHDLDETECGLAIVGPCAPKVMESAGLEARGELQSVAKVAWDGIGIVLSRLGEHGGYEIWCHPSDATSVWDRIAAAGAAFALTPAGVEAMDVLDLEAGIARPGRDYAPARSDFGTEPMVSELGLSSLIDNAHGEFNGRRAHLAGVGHEKRLLVGLRLGSEVPAPFAPLMHEEYCVGQTLSSVYSPALRSAIAFAMIEPEFAVPDTKLNVADGNALVSDLPFLPLSAQIDS
jgi:aminomethyltransferase